jgi:predicted histidine transporter YuiF (NhaC family)
MPLLALSAVIFVLHFLIVHLTATWIPTLPILASLTVAIFFTRRKTNQYRRGRFHLPW